MKQNKVEQMQRRYAIRVLAPLLQLIGSHPAIVRSRIGIPYNMPPQNLHKYSLEQILGKQALEIVEALRYLHLEIIGKKEIAMWRLNSENILIPVLDSFVIIKSQGGSDDNNTLGF